MKINNVKYKSKNRKNKFKQRNPKRKYQRFKIEDLLKLNMIPSQIRLHLSLQIM